VVVSDAAWADAATDNIKITIENKPTAFQIFPFIIIAFSGLFAFYLKLALVELCLLIISKLTFLSLNLKVHYK
jgi:hypothetical protein